MRVTKFPITILAAALLSGCVTRVVTADRNSTASPGEDGNGVLLMPVFVLPPDSNDDRNTPDVPPRQSGREIQAQWIRVPTRTGFAEPVLFSADQTKIHFVAIPPAGVQRRLIANSKTVQR
jgi:hypothetical protein